jgi:hypothetical protein
MLQNRTSTMMPRLSKPRRDALPERRVVRSFKIVFAVLFTAGLVLCACGQGSSDSSTTSSSSAGAGGARECVNITTIYGPCDPFFERDCRECGGCMQQECCDEVAACIAVENCRGCFLGGQDYPGEEKCTEPILTLNAALDNCAYDRCKPVCFRNQHTSSSSG